jgi:hypothetical protein
MTHNPYTPPAAAVGDQPQIEAGKRPAAVLIAVMLICAYVLFGVFGYLRFWQAYLTAAAMDLIMLGFQVAKWLVMFALCFFLWRGRNWARFLLLAVTGLSVLSVFVQIVAIADLPAGARHTIDPMGIVMMLVPPLVYLLATFLVFVPGRAWFARLPAPGSP